MPRERRFTHRLLTAWPSVRDDARVMTLEAEAVTPTSIADTFAFFADPANLARITPPWLDFRIVTPMPIEMREGTLIDYRIVVRGVPLPWRSRIDVWEPGRRFVDRQLLGPYLWWRHEHLFEEIDEGTRVVDRVEYVPRFRLLSGSLVRRDVERIFTYRQDALTHLLKAIAISGGVGVPGAHGQFPCNRGTNLACFLAWATRFNLRQPAQAHCWSGTIGPSSKAAR